jgi:spore coat protein H
MKPIRFLLIIAFLFGAVTACKDKTEDITPDPITANSDWTTESHSNDADPNYDVIFPQNQVNTLEITMTAADWTSIKTDMQTKSGTAFGAGEEIHRAVLPGALREGMGPVG